MRRSLVITRIVCIGTYPILCYFGAHTIILEKFHNVISKHHEKYENDQENLSFLWNDVKILRKERNRYKRDFSEMVFIKKEKDNSLDKITDIEHLNSSYNMILDFLS